VALATGFGEDRPLAGGATDGVEIACPAGMRAVTGGFFTESSTVFLNTSAPGQTANSWQVFVTNTGTEATTWAPTATCS
jgi:hypothetical protein